MKLITYTNRKVKIGIYHENQKIQFKGYEILNQINVAIILNH